MDKDTQGKSKKQAHVYDVENMVVTAWGNRFAYWRYDVKNVPAEIREYALKGFIDDLQDCTTSIKKADYPKSEKGEEDYRLDCLKKRRELEGHINAGTRPARLNANPEKAEDKRIAGLVKEQLKGVSLTGLILKQTLHPETFTEEDSAKLKELMTAALKAEKNAKK